MTPLLTFYGDDFTGSTDALEQLTLAGVRTVLFTDPPTVKELGRFKNLQAVGVAGMTRAMTPTEMERTLPPALNKLKALGARHVHYKVCSTFDSSPRIGSIGKVIEIGARIFQARFIPLLAAAPALGRHCVFGNLFARFGIGSNGGMHRLDRHPSVSRHPITPMREADLRVHLAKQTRKRIALFDILKVALPPQKARAALEQLLADRPDAVLFDALYTADMRRLGELIDGCASRERPLFLVGSSGIEMALGAHWMARGMIRPERGPQLSRTRIRNAAGSRSSLSTAGPLLVASGSCSPVTLAQIDWALANGFAEVALDSRAIANGSNGGAIIANAAASTLESLRDGRSVIVHTGRQGSDKEVAVRLQGRTANVLGSALGRVVREALKRADVLRLCIAGGDTSSFVARSIGVAALEMIAPLTPGAPLCRAHGPGSPADGLQVVFKGGQVGAPDYFETVRPAGRKSL